MGGLVKLNHPFSQPLRDEAFLAGQSGEHVGGMPMLTPPLHTNPPVTSHSTLLMAGTARVGVLRARVG